MVQLVHVPVVSPSPGGLLTGNTLWVDAVYGIDALAQRDNASLPFLTVAAALVAALPGDSVFLRPGTHNLAAGILIPDGVTLQGQSHSNAILQMLNVTAATTLLEMGVDCHVQDVLLRLTSAQHHTLVGVYFNGPTSGTAQLSNSRVIVNNAGAGAGASNVTGVLVQSTGSPIVLDQLDSVTVVVDSIGTGSKRGILMDSFVGSFLVAETDVQVASAGSIDCIGVEINIAGGLLQFLTGSISQSPAAPATTNGDISQTAGTLRIGSVALLQSSCKLLNFLSVVQSGTLVWADLAGVPVGPVFMRPGTAAATAVEADAQIRIARAQIVKTLSVHASTGPGGVATCTVTVRKNGVSTLLAAQLVGVATTVENLVNAVEFAAGDLLSIQISDTGATTDPTVTLEMF